MFVTRKLRRKELRTIVTSCCHPLGGGGVLIYFSVQGRAAEQGIIFRIPTPGQGVIFVIFVIFDFERSF